MIPVGRVLLSNDMMNEKTACGHIPQAVAVIARAILNRGSICCRFLCYLFLICGEVDAFDSSRILLGMIEQIDI